MPENWKTYNLGELVDLKQGLAINKKTNHLLCDSGNNSIPLFKIRDLLNDTVEHYVKADEVPKQCIAKKEDLIYSRTGQVGHIFKGKVGCIHNNCFKIIPSEKLDSGFLYHYLRNPVIRQYANDIASGSVQKDLNHTAFKSIPIKVPENLQEQKSIAAILSALDDKIELNLQMNQTLEEMAMALYKHWFVDFGPFQDGEFVDSELGEIPKGWEVKTVQDFGKVITGKTPSKKFPEHFGEEIVFVTPTDFKSYGKHITTAARGISKSGIEKHKNSILPKNSVIVTCIGSDMGKVAVNKVRCLTNQQINSLVTEHYLYLYLFFKSNYNLLKMLAGDGTTMPIINKTSFQNIKVILPPQKILKEFETQIQDWDEQMHLNTIENQTLTQLRDTLLPKLISGEVRVKDAEKNLSEVL